MKIEEKLIDFKNSIEQLSNKDYIEINKNVENEINDSIYQEIDKYTKKKELSYNKNIQNMEKEYNKKIYNYEIDCKKKIIEEEKKIRKQIKENCIVKLKEFVNQESYREYLKNNIKNAFYKIDDKNSIVIYLTQKDIYKFEDEIKTVYSSKIVEMPDGYIGGCIIGDEQHGIFIDNTLMNLLNEIMA